MDLKIENYSFKFEYQIYQKTKVELLNNKLFSLRIARNKPVILNEFYCPIKSMCYVDK